MKYRRRRRNAAGIFRRLLLLFFAGYTAASCLLAPRAVDLAETEICRFVQTTVHETMRETLAAFEDTGGEVGRKENGTVAYVQTDAALLTRIQTRVCNDVSRALADSCRISVRMGSLLPFPLFSAKGPKIPLRLEPDGVAAVTFENEFVSVGVNQSLHRIRMDVTVRITAKALWYSKVQVVETSFVLGETLIVGDVPGGVYTKWGS